MLSIRTTRCRSSFRWGIRDHVIDWITIIRTSRYDGLTEHRNVNRCIDWKQCTLDKECARGSSKQLMHDVILLSWFMKDRGIEQIRRQSWKSHIRIKGTLKAHWEAARPVRSRGRSARKSTSRWIQAMRRTSVHALMYSPIIPLYSLPRSRGERRSFSLDSCVVAVVVPWASGLIRDLSVKQRLRRGRTTSFR